VEKADLLFPWFEGEWNEVSGVEGKRMTLAARLGFNPAVLALSVARLADAMGNSILFIIIPLYVAELPSPWFPWPEPMRAGVLISMYGLVNACLQPFTGGLSDRINRRKPFIQGGLILMGVSTLSFSFASRFTDLLLLRALQGVGVALTIPASMAVMAKASARQTRGGSMGIYSTARMTGFAAGPLLGGFLYDRFGFNWAFYAATALIFIALILVQVLVKEAPAAATISGKSSFLLFDRHLLNAGILGAGLATFMMAGAFSMMTPLEEQFNQRLHETALAFSVAFSALMVSRLVLQIPLGKLSDRYGRKPFIIFGLVLMALSTALLSEAATTEQLIWIRVLQGIGAAGIAAPTFALAGDLARAGGEGQQMSIVTMGFGLGIALGPLLAGLLAASSFHLPFFFMGIILLVSAWVIYEKVPETVSPRGNHAALNTVQ
jgi:MFS family permease